MYVESKDRYIYLYVLQLKVKDNFVLLYGEAINKYLKYAEYFYID